MCVSGWGGDRDFILYSLFQKIKRNEKQQTYV